MSTRLTDPSASMLSDLAAAYLARAAQRRDAHDLLLAADVATAAIELDASYAPAWFNRALALDELTLSGQAKLAWATYVRLDGASEWANEARARAEMRPRAPVQKRPQNINALDSLRGFAQASPAEAFNLAFDVALGAWGRAVIASDEGAAAASIRAAETIAEVLVQRGDSMIRHAVGVAAGIPQGSPARRALAIAHARFAAGRSQSPVDSGFTIADTCFAAAIRHSVSSPAFRMYAAFTRANHRIAADGELATRQALQPIQARVDAQRYPLLAGRVDWVLGVLEIRAGEFDAGIARLHRARTRFDVLGAREYSAIMMGIEGEALLKLGIGSNGLNEVWRAARLLADNPSSVNRHNALNVLARTATDQGLRRVAIAIAQEDSTVADLSGRPISAAEVQLARARAFRDGGDDTLAARALSNADRVILELSEGPERRQLEMERAATAIFGSRTADIKEGRNGLDSAVTFFHSTGAKVRLVRALIARADASVRLGEDAAAEADLTRAAALFNEQSALLSRVPQRSALLRQARLAFDRLVALRLASGRDREARDALEQGRASFAPIAAPRRSTDRQHGPSIDYALIGDSLFAWVDDGSHVRVNRLRVDRAELAATIDRVTAALERDTPTTTWASDLKHLYDILIRPNVAALGPRAATLAIVTPDELANVPFSALLDGKTGRFIVEDYAIRLAPSLADLWRGSPAPARPHRRAAFVADPPLDRRLFPTLEPLPGAAREVDASAAAYRDRVVLQGASADSAAAVRALGSTSVFHFAGHAVFDANQPERSFLAVGPRGLRASAIAALDLRGLDLAVLSACETGRVVWTRSGGPAGLADAFLIAGARGVVAAQWRTNDARTLRLMQSLHASFSTGVDAANALRRAQLELLRSSDPALASPSTWSAFTYHGQ